MLPVAHKYCMERIEGALVARLEELSTQKFRPEGTVACVGLMVAAQLLDSKDLYEKALEGLRSCKWKPNLEQASLIGLPAYFAVMKDLRINCNSCPRSGTLLCMD